VQEGKGNVYLVDGDHLRYIPSLGYYRIPEIDVPLDYLLSRIKGSGMDTESIDHVYDYFGNRRILIEVPEEEIEREMEQNRLRKEWEAKIAERLQKCTLLWQSDKVRAYLLDDEELAGVFLDAVSVQMVKDLGRLIVIAGPYFDEPYRVASLSIHMPTKVLAAKSLLERRGVPGTLTVKNEGVPGPKYLIRLTFRHLDPLGYCTLYLDPDKKCVEMAPKARVIYEDGKLVLIDDEAVEELMRERGA